MRKQSESHKNAAKPLVRKLGQLSKATKSAPRRGALSTERRALITTAHSMRAVAEALR